MDTGKAVYDWAGAPEDYALGKDIVPIYRSVTMEYEDIIDVSAWQRTVFNVS
jgi:hypothetical protein